MSTVEVGLSAVILAVTDEVPRVLTVHHAGRPPALPYGTLEPTTDRTLELALRRWVADLTGLDLGYVEQLYTFGDRNRAGAGPTRRIVSLAYLALVHQGLLAEPGTASWTDIYDHLPWEDWRDGPPEAARIAGRALQTWSESDHGAFREQRERRIDIAFARSKLPWDEERVLERYELLYEAGLVREARLDHPDRYQTDNILLGLAMKHDHRRMLASALGRLRGKLKYRPLVFELLSITFTLSQLQRLVEALSGRRLHKQNFRRLVIRGGLVEGTGQRDHSTGGRPAELFKFRQDVLEERPAPGVGLPRK